MRLFILLSLSLVVLGCQSNYDMQAFRGKLSEDFNQAPLYVPDEMLSKPINLEKVIEIGLLYNFELNLSKLEVEIARRQAKIEAWGKAPTFKGSHSFTRRSNYRKQSFLNPDTNIEVLSSTVSEERSRSLSDLELSWIY